MNEPLSPEEEAKFRESVRLLEQAEGESGANALHWTNTVAARLLATLDAARRASDAQVAGLLEPCPECHHPWAWHLTEIHMVPETCYCERKPDLPESRRELGLRNALEKIADKIEAAAYHRNYRQAAIDIQVITLGALASAPAPQPATPPLDVERLRCGWCGDDLRLEHIVGHLASEGREIPHARLAEPRSPSQAEPETGRPTHADCVCPQRPYCKPHQRDAGVTGWCFPHGHRAPQPVIPTPPTRPDPSKSAEKAGPPR